MEFVTTASRGLRRALSTWGRRAALAGLVAAAASNASAAAGYVTTNEVGLDAIFSQASFGSNKIDIRFTAALSYNMPALTAFDSDSEWNALYALANPNSNVVSMFFVDTISSCGGPGSGIIGCADVPGHLLVLNSFYAAGSFGSVLAAHELGHNLGLFHTGDGNLMSGVISSNSDLLLSQVSTILSSNLVQIDASTGQRYITITPIALVPEPGSWLMMGLGLGLLGWRARRRGLSRG